MKSIISLLVLWVCATAEPLGTAIQRRSARMGIYASDYTRGYKPYAYMAIPLHAPLPVLHVISPTPLYRPNRAVNRYVEQPKMYASSMPHMWYARPPLEAQPSASDIVPAPEILYARPNPQGGYTYHKRPNKNRKPTPPPEPIIIRVHKYRYYKDDI